MNALHIIQQKLKDTYAKKRNYDANIYLLIILNISSLTILALMLINFAFNLKEFIAFICLASVASFAFWGLISFFYLRTKPIKKYSHISEKIENKTRQYQDSLNAVANIIDQNKSDLSPIEVALIANTANYAGKNLSTDFLKPITYNKRVILLVAILFTSICVVCNNHALIKKGVWGYGDWSHGNQTYFKIEPENFKARRGSTIKINAELTRERILGAPVVVTILKSNLPSEKILLRHFGNNSYGVNIYDIQEDFQYVVSNSNSESAKYYVTVFDIPEIKEKEITIEPPAYTGLPMLKLSEFEYITVPENSRIQIKITPNKESDIFFMNKGKITPFIHEKKLAYTFLFRINEYTEYIITLIDKEKHQYETNPAWVLETVPDLPPYAEIKLPDNDKKVLGIEELEFKYTLSDDYGISKALIIFFLF